MHICSLDEPLLCYYSSNRDCIGMDMQLLRLVNDFLKENGLSTSVLPDKTAFPTETRFRQTKTVEIYGCLIE